MVDITSKHLSEQFPVYTKAGEIWKNRIDWSEALKPGTIVSTHFGNFTFVNSYKEGKDWFLVLDAGDIYITIKRTQARNNKNLPRHCTVTYKLGTIVDNLFMEVRAAVVEHNLEVLDKQKGKRGKKSRKGCYAVNTIKPGLTEKINYIKAFGKRLKPEKYKKYKHWIINFYHPDKNSKTSSDFMNGLFFLLN